ncbi:MAG: hypothetical protein IIZ64_01545 [Erysipelotrichaceae bacterium]|nr:hypothetical protein [Erysipelotrichaceae bacterium]MBQ1533483.1 hypothetical protein [Erysipelotrichaceae bacterium]
MTDREQRVHDLALIVVENSLEDIDESYGIRQYAKEAVKIYNEAVKVIEKELD